MGADLMELPRIQKGNKYVLVQQDHLPLAYPLPDQKTQTIAHISVDEVSYFSGYQKLCSLTGELKHLMKDQCGLLEITKLNTTAYHLECDGMVERFDRTLKVMLGKHADLFEDQWDHYLPNVLWPYRNVQHESTGEKPSFLLFGLDLQTPTKAVFLGQPHL